MDVDRFREPSGLLAPWAINPCQTTEIEGSEDDSLVDACQTAILPSFSA
jgi:hypothetical protein